MKHFIGGWALGVAIESFVHVNGFSAMDMVSCQEFAFLLLGPLLGLAAWGLIP